jgi:hypothetical protein
MTLLLFSVFADGNADVLAPYVTAEVHTHTHTHTHTPTHLLSCVSVSSR